TIRLPCAAPHDPCGTRAARNVLLLTSSRPGRFPGKQETKVVHRPEGKGMLHPIRAAARLIDQKIGWNRIGLALSLVIIVSAAVVLYRILHGIEFSEVIVALKATDPADA